MASPSTYIPVRGIYTPPKSPPPEESPLPEPQVVDPLDTYNLDPYALGPTRREPSIQLVSATGSKTVTTPATQPSVSGTGSWLDRMLEGIGGIFTNPKVAAAMAASSAAAEGVVPGSSTLPQALQSAAPGESSTSKPAVKPTPTEVAAAEWVGKLLKQLAAADNFQEAKTIVDQIKALIVKTQVGETRATLMDKYAELITKVYEPLRLMWENSPEGKAAADKAAVDKAATDKATAEAGEGVLVPIPGMEGAYYDPRTEGYLNIARSQAETEQLRAQIAQLKANALTAASRAEAERKQASFDQEMRIADFISRVVGSPSQQVRLMARYARQEGLPSVPTGERTGVLSSLFPALGIPEEVAIRGRAISPAVAKLFEGIKAGQGIPLTGTKPELQYGSIPQEKLVSGLTPVQQTVLSELFDISGVSEADVKGTWAERRRTAPTRGVVGLLTRR